MLGLNLKLLKPQSAIPIPIPRRLNCNHNRFTQTHLPNRILTKPKKPLLSVKARNGNDTNPKNGNEDNDGDGDGDGDGNGNGNGRSRLNVGWWRKILLDPDPDNVLAVGLTGLLTWASVTVVWQLCVVAVAIVVAGLKYSLIAALLIFILIALL